MQKTDQRPANHARQVTMATELVMQRQTPSLIDTGVRVRDREREKCSEVCRERGGGAGRGAKLTRKIGVA